MDNPNFTLYTPTAPLSRHRLREMCSSHTLPTPCVLVHPLGDKSHRDVPTSVKQIFCVYMYIFIVLNFMNQILSKLRKESYT
jgi:hypothetical protein